MARTWGAFGPRMVRCLSHSHQSEPKFERNFEGFNEKKNLFKFENHRKNFKNSLNFSE
jgi:hypothetical protein